MLSKIIEFVLRVIRFKSIIKRMALHPSRSKKQFVPNNLLKIFNVKTQLVNSKVLATLESKNSLVTESKTHIIYLHGGAYVFEASMLHWRLIEKLINRLDCTISVIDYPLAPENNYKTTIDMVINSYKYILSNYTNDKLVLMGDSAGGGLALACVLKLKKEYALALPDKLILLSPWLDLTLTNPEIKLYEKNDVQLSYDFLKYCADKYANNEDKRNYELSPINSSLKGLPNAIVFYGSKELFVPDIEKFKVKAEAERVNIKFRKYEGMQHDWILFPIEESNMAISEICDFVESSSN